MTEAEWLVSGDPMRMLEFLRERATDRKFILVACACGRSVSHLLTDPRSRAALPLVENFADGLASQLEMDAVFQPACDAAREAARYPTGITDGPPLPSWAAAWVAAKAVIATSTMRGEDAFFGAVDSVDFTGSALGWAPVPLLRDIFGNPFRPVSFSPDWRTETAAALAQQMYDSRDFSAMPILADALQDAGCDSEAILSHCRDASGVHVRGCWVVDLVLGKS